MPAASASSTIGVRSADVSKLCQVPMPTAGTCSEVWPSLRRSSGLFEVLDRHRLDRICQREAEDFRIEVELCFKRAFDVLRHAEAVLLALERKVSHRQSFLTEGIDDDLRLVGRHDLVLQPLKEDHGRRDAIDRVDRGALAVDVPILRPSAQQALVVHRLELVRVAVKVLQVADAEVRSEEHTSELQS